jgi:cytoskeletal protein CcmA (bactofilin family)
MSAAIITLAVVALTLVWFGLPLIPTIIEVRKRTEARPLAVDRENDGEVRHFARRFKAYIESNFQEPALAERLNQGTAWEGYFNDRTPYQIIEKSGEAFLRMARTVASIPALAIFSGAISLPDRLKFPFGLYASEDIETGANAVVRSVYGKSNVRLKEGTSVLRWIHAEGDLSISSGCAIYGRASSDRNMQVGPGVEFERLHATRLMFGIPVPAQPAATAPFPAAFKPNAKPMSGDCFSVDGDLEVPPNTLLRGNFVVLGNIKLGRRSRIEGSLKSHEDFQTESGVIIEGSVVSGRDLDIGAGCQIYGPAVARRRLRIREGAQIGSDLHPTSAIAPSIIVDRGVLVYGTVWARESGRTGESNAD